MRRRVTQPSVMLTPSPQSRPASNDPQNTHASPPSPGVLLVGDGPAGLGAGHRNRSHRRDVDGELCLGQQRSTGDGGQTKQGKGRVKGYGHSATSTRGLLPTIVVCVHTRTWKPGLAVVAGLASGGKLPLEQLVPW